MKRRSFLLSATLAASAGLSRGQNAPVAQPDWFPFEPEDDFTGPSVIGMADWLDRPAGKHGFLQARGDRLVFEDGTPVKFWGTNVCNARVAPPKERAERLADRFAKYGVNLVRLHKFTRPGPRQGIREPSDSLVLIESLARQWDYFCATLAARGHLHRLVAHLSPPAFASGPRARRGLRRDHERESPLAEPAAQHAGAGKFRS